MLSVEERVHYYTAGLSKQWVIDFDQKTGRCFYEKNGTKLIYEAPLEHQHGTVCMGKNYTGKMFEKMALERFNGRIIDGEKNLPSISITKAVHNYNINAYINPIIDLLNKDIYFKNKFVLHRIGDVFFSTEVPIITKTRPTKSMHELSLHKKLLFYSIYQNNVIINLDAIRHWHEPLNIIKDNDISFSQKNDKIIWRGEWNGMMIQIIQKRPIRYNLIKKYVNHPNKMIDIGFVSDYIKDNQEEFINDYTKTDQDIKGKGRISIQQQLQSKFIISVEGGDVATNLKWILYSNSTPVMPKPTMCSWLMEDKLEPWIHYVPLENDFGDLEEKYSWCLNNLDKCEEIAKNGKKYMEQFLDREREAKITNLVLRRYVDNVSVNLIE